MRSTVCRKGRLLLAEDGCRREKEFLLEGRDGPQIHQSMKVKDIARSSTFEERCKHAIDAEYRAAMRLVAPKALKY